MQDERTAGIDLPMKILVWEGDDGVVNATYNDSHFLGHHHRIEGPDEQIDQINTVLRAIATAGLDDGDDETT